MLKRFCTLLLLLLTVETVVFVYAHDDLITLRGDPVIISRSDDATLRQLASSVLARRHLTRRHLETLAEALRRQQLFDEEVRALERLHAEHTADTSVDLRLADAYRRARRFDAATAIYRGLIDGVEQ